MKSVRWRMRAGSLGMILISLSGCGVVPVPKALQPVLGTPPKYSNTSLCIVDPSARRGLRVVEAQREENSGRLFVLEGRKRRKLTPSPEHGYAGEESWFRGEEPIRQYGRRYVKYGPRRVVPANALTRGADHKGTLVFIDRKDTERPSALYIPVEPGCVLQPYVDERYAGTR
jgi:hypothetical protein